MKIIGIGRNYADHAKELGNEVPESPVIFLKPDTAILRNNAPFYFPTFTKNVHYEVELVIKICKEGKNIEEKFAAKYFNEIGIGIDFTARDLQDYAKSKGLPWTLAKGFNGSAPISDFIPVEEFSNIHNINFGIKINDQERQQGNSSQMIHNFYQIIAYVSQYMTLKIGDLIFTGTPAGVGPVVVGDRLSAFIENKQMLRCNIK